MAPNQPITHSEMTQMMEIVAKNAEHSESIANSLKLLNEKIETIVAIKKDVDFVKTLVTVVSLAVVVATVILRGIDNRILFREEVKAVVQEMKKDK